jgi:hypothetical protein
MILSFDAILFMILSFDAILFMIKLKTVYCGHIMPLFSIDNSYDLLELYIEKQYKYINSDEIKQLEKMNTRLLFTEYLNYCKRNGVMEKTDYDNMLKEHRDKNLLSGGSYITYSDNDLYNLLVMYQEHMQDEMSVDDIDELKLLHECVIARCGPDIKLKVERY